MFPLRIEIGPVLAARQAAWFAPKHQPFVVAKDIANTIDATPLSGGLPAELRDTFEIYILPGELVSVLLCEEEFNDLGRTARSDLVRNQIRLGREAIPSVRSEPADLLARVSKQAEGTHRLVWWPSLLQGHEELILGVYLRFGRRPSRLSRSPKASGRMPGQHCRAQGDWRVGTFPHASGPDCFGAEMAAASRSEAAETWMLQNLSRAGFPRRLSQTEETLTLVPCSSGAPLALPWRLGAAYRRNYRRRIRSPQTFARLDEPEEGPHRWEIIASARQSGRRLSRYTLTAPRDFFPLKDLGFPEMLSPPLLGQS